mgnify:CR=1 FL=1
MTIVEAIILGVIQGLTEFLPISSSGHLVLSQVMLGIKIPGNDFEILLHIGTLCSILFVFNYELKNILFTLSSKETQRFILMLLAFYIYYHTYKKISEDTYDRLPLLTRDGHFIRQGYDSRLDEFRQMRDDSRRLMAGLQANYAEITGVSALKIKHNNVLGYHIEVRAAHSDKLMSNTQFIHRQTTAQALRFTTTELAEMEQALGSASDKALALEVHLFLVMANRKV